MSKNVINPRSKLFPCKRESLLGFSQIINYKESSSSKEVIGYGLLRYHRRSFTPSFHWTDKRYFFCKFDSEEWLWESELYVHIR
jgi:hypothetical protein